MIQKDNYMSLLNKKDKENIGSSSQVIIDYFTDKISMKSNESVNLKYTDNTFSISSTRNDGYVAMRASTLNDIYKHIGKSFTIKSDIDIVISMDEDAIIPDPINIHVPDGEIEFFTAEDDRVYNIRGVNIKSKSFKIESDLIHIYNSNIQVERLNFEGEKIENINDCIHGNVNTDEVLYTPKGLYFETLPEDIGLTNIIDNINVYDLSKINPIEQSGLDIYCDKTHIFHNCDETIVITKEFNKYFQFGRMRELDGGWFLLRTNADKLFNT